ncbi:hypothetical protein OV090_45375 [Nannocystis sp. RBIL2]|uniref:hypothetical protein n=1 Tax=Nannocystis sp. RBIL2 TaxID=2996788 RepID=UPI0022704E4A|nr:hypothetical protein [Nannocystis sp. RBIL2]MCY1072062.1 hypothetical protein [Nannocystis sp. RBIL2]
MRRRVEPAMCTFALLLACGDPTGASTENASETSAASTDATAATSEAASTDETTSAGQSSTSDAATDANTDTTTSTSTTAEPTSGETPLTTDDATTTGGDSTITTTSSDTTTGTTGAPTQPLTQAWWVDGNNLQIRVIQRDDDAGLCRGFILEALANGGFDDPKYEPVEQPDEWGVRVVFVHQDLDDCFDPYLFFRKDPAYADSAAGTVTFHDVDQDGRPASVDLEITGLYTPAAPWVPDEDLFAAAGVAVETG